MNVVGKVGSLISQGVYSVATPFHPFGGAVDVIVVQQQDGTFRSTPWYVRFGKFQGVLKGAEKVVRIAVNGVEANFHMYLDNSGEAYFIKVDAGKGGEINEVAEDSDNLKVTAEDSSLGDNNKDSNYNINGIHILEHSASDSGVVGLRDEYVPLRPDRIERVESDVDRRFYDFQDEQSSFEGSVELSEYGSNRYDCLDGEAFVEPQSLNAEVVLVSVDGYVLTAPISTSEQNTENVQLSTPQFHLGPGDGADFCEGNEEFSTGENVWAVDYISKMSPSTANGASVDVGSISNNDNAFGHQLEVWEGEGGHVCQSQEAMNIADQQGKIHVQSDSEDVSPPNKSGEVFKSCLELSELTKQVGNTDLKDVVSSLDAQCSEETSQQSSQVVKGGKDWSAVESRNDDGLSASCSSSSPGNMTSPGLQVQVESIEENAWNAEAEVEHMDDSKSVHSVYNGSESKDGKFTTSAAFEGVDECSNNEPAETHTGVSIEENQTHSILRFEISLCRNELHPGMGLEAAAEAFDAHRISAEEFTNSSASIISNENLIVRFRERYLPWEKAAHLVLGVAAFGLDLPVEPKDAIPVEQDGTPQPRDDDSGNTPSSGRRWRLWPIPFRRVKTLEHASSNSSNDDVFVDSESGNSTVVSTLASHNGNGSPHKQLIRTNVPTNEQIASLSLKEGQNIITFSFSTRVLGTQKVDAHIYLWKWNARIVISDVDGTITKSDVLGQFMPLVGRDWTQSGVARLFSAIKENGYHLLFLSARAIVQAYLTRSFLLNLKQDGNTLPNGPVVISPDGLFPSLYREVIRRAPHEFKIACLEDIRKLFPSECNPFYAGFGNRDTDELSYRKIGIPKGKIFIINPKGEVAISHRIDVKSYTSLHTLVNDMFPPTSLVEQEDYNSWNYWKMPVADIDL
ncbi:phosphatidate phosphatase PAH1 [Juglans microcarpa x Juglans regia]|uniref:phosphatidate phosphatase PAH1 n=1 Tax=Juglans microcarpa x Juglans regia TaxID=2249226 RepID=UPI001B7E061F|nr:phosphatidate phosphatase PAH1 [Juglans microcarpa x Juglans regia]